VGIVMVSIWLLGFKFRILVSVGGMVRWVLLFIGWIGFRVGWFVVLVCMMLWFFFNVVMSEVGVD